MTLNPALDLTYTVDALIPHATHRVSSVRSRAGGKGLNVARVLHALGEPVLATGIVGGAVGTQITDLLRTAGLPSSFVTAPIESRRTVTVADGTDATGFWEPGPQITAESWSAFMSHFRTLLPRATVVALCGSLPPGIPTDGYATLTLLAAEHDVPVVLDTSGPALHEALAARPHIAKPNAAELADLLAHRKAPPPATAAPSPPQATSALSPPPTASASSPPPTGSSVDASPTTVSAWRERAEHVRSLGARSVVVSRGPQGLLAVAEGGGWEAPPPEVVAGNPTGAGDACVAALARGLRDGTPWPEMLADAVALSGATVAAPVAGSFDPDTYHRLRAAAAVVGHPVPPRC
ncbi:1-phosphofructokinase family hexose kinase [Actinoplanes sp. NPDC051470]|uniref:1-phosphofructokinase family hexose kinase n=1 Tax=unclassified Actinoplanes TaxID=2626549 RepID=UPI003443D800